MKPRLLDLFCGAGGAGMGYHRAGFEVVGVDIKPQPHYPFEFHQADALTFPLEGFDAIHASPPCQFYTRLRTLPWLRDREYWESIPPTMDRVRGSGIPWVVENVESRTAADALGTSWLLCATMFGLRWDDGRQYRHRLFASSEFMLAPGHPKHESVLVPGPLLKDRGRLNNGYVVGGHQNGLRAKNALGIDWMTGNELSQSVPPAYTEHIGRQLLEAGADRLPRLLLRFVHDGGPTDYIVVPGGRPMSENATKSYWAPDLDDLVWMNRPDFDEPEGRVVGFVPAGHARAGQPIIERVADLPGVFGGYRKGERVVIAPVFLLPFPFGSEQWKQAERKGLIR